MKKQKQEEKPKDQISNQKVRPAKNKSGGSTSCPVGVGKERCRLDYVSAGEGEKITKVIREMVESVRTLGPLLLIPENCR